MSLTIEEQLADVRKAIEPARQDAQAKWSAFETKRTEVLDSGVSLADATGDTSEAFKALDEVHTDAGEAAERYAQLTAREKSLQSMTATTGLPPVLKDAIDAARAGELETWGARIVDNDVYKQGIASGLFSTSGDAKFGRVNLGRIADRAELFAVVRGEDGSGVSFDPVNRRPGVVTQPERTLRLVDLITVLQSDSDSIDMVVETGFTNAAAPVGEATTEADIGGAVTAALAGLKPLSALQLEVVKLAAVTLAHAIPVTRRAFRNKAQIRSVVDTKLRFGLADVLDLQIAAGDGVGENLRGIANTPGINIQLYDDEAASPAEAMLIGIRKAMTKTAIAGYPATAVGMDPVDSEGIRLLRDNSGGPGTGQFLFGPPSQSGDQTVWGRPVAESVAFTDGQPLVGDFRQAELYLIGGVQVLVSDSHSDWFLKNLLAILAEFEAAFGVAAPKAFCEVRKDANAVVG